MQENKFKSEKGSMAIYAIATILSFLMILVGVFFTSSVIRKNQLRTLIKIKDVYASQMQQAEEITEELKLKQPIGFDYRGAVEEWTPPTTGIYKLEVWGAQGGGSWYNSAYQTGGKGGYSVGTIKLSTLDKLYIYVGGIGTDSTNGYSSGGFNGGGNSWSSNKNNGAGAGGGASDIRLGKDDKYARIIVAGGGGGANTWHTGYNNTEYSSQAHGGGAEGLKDNTDSSLSGNGGTQTSGFEFANGESATTTGSYTSGGGGGWYGGYKSAGGNGGDGGRRIRLDLHRKDI